MALLLEQGVGDFTQVPLGVCVLSGAQVDLSNLLAHAPILRVEPKDAEVRPQRALRAAPVELLKGLLFESLAFVAHGLTPGGS
ncbi:hypothetical protein LBMAG42_03970 [Deltaproteobacteria bacterium]|nr:hypothetical protein LBMAG42_03970 [Deltaproteobacteria bacterium]